MHLIARLLTSAQPVQRTGSCEEHPNFWMYPCR